MSHLYCDECDSHFCVHVRVDQVYKANHEQLKTENAQLRVNVSELKQQVARDTGRLLNLRAACRRLREHQIKLTLEVNELRRQVAGQVSFVSTEAADELYANNASLQRQLDKARSALYYAGWTNDQISRLLKDESVIR